MTSVLTHVHAARSTYYTVTTALLAGVAVYEYQPAVGHTAAYMTAPSANLLSNLGLATTDCILRDMGKVVYGAYGSAAGPKGYYRQVQLLVPSSLTSFLGGPSGPTFGVGLGGVVDTYSSYFTFFLAVPVGGILGGILSDVTEVIGGEM